jgi:uncharacterized phiE125 gp8 family phage protein
VQESIAITTPPASPLVSLADMKLHLRVDIADDDSLIGALVAAATAAAEARLKMSLVTRSYAWTLDYFPNRVVFNGPAWGYSRAFTEARVYPFSQAQAILLPRPPLVSVDSVQFYDPAGTLQTLDPSAYTVQVGTPGRVAPAPGHYWPATQDRLGSVVVRFTAGFGTDPAAVPASVPVAVKLLVGHWYRNREATSEAGLAEVPKSVDYLLNAASFGFYQ